MSSGLLKYWWSMSFFSCFNSWKATSVYGGVFSATGIAGYVQKIALNGVQKIFENVFLMQ